MNHKGYIEVNVIGLNDCYSYPDHEVLEVIMTNQELHIDTDYNNFNNNTGTHPTTQTIINTPKLLIGRKVDDVLSILRTEHIAMTEKTNILSTENKTLKTTAESFGVKYNQCNDSLVAAKSRSDGLRVERDDAWRSFKVVEDDIDKLRKNLGDLQINEILGLTDG